jgi:hypothetical protein
LLTSLSMIFCGQVFGLITSIVSVALDGAFLGELNGIGGCINTKRGTYSGNYAYYAATYYECYGYSYYSYNWDDCGCVQKSYTDYCYYYYGSAISGSCEALFTTVPHLVAAGLAIDIINLICIFAVLVYSSMFLCCAIKCGFEVSTSVSAVTPAQVIEFPQLAAATSIPSGMYVQMAPQQMAWVPQQGQGAQVQVSMVPSQYAGASAQSQGVVQYIPGPAQTVPLWQAGNSTGISYPQQQMSYQPVAMAEGNVLDAKLA